jgi:hypothetical protein
MATPQTPQDPSISVIRRRLISAAADDGAADPRSESIDFEAMGGHELQLELERSARAPAARQPDEVDALLQRYQAEKGGPALPDLEVRPPSNGLSANGLRRPGSNHSAPRPSGSFHGEALRGTSSRQGLPPLTGAGHAEWEKLRSENAELRAMVAELRQYLEENDPTAWEQKVKDADAAVAARDEMLAAQRAQTDEWSERLKTHRFVPNDHDLAEMSDELEKERCQLAQDRKTLDAERQQLREDEESLMKQMRDMEMSMAKDRADLARQRIDNQRLQSEIRHELDLLARGDASVKDRLATFQRRSQEAGVRPQQSPTAPLPSPAAMPMSAAPPKAANSTVFKRLFGKPDE